MCWINKINLKNVAYSFELVSPYYISNYYDNKFYYHYDNYTWKNERVRIKYLKWQVFYSIYTFAIEYKDEWGRSFTVTSTERN